MALILVNYTQFVICHTIVWSLPIKYVIAISHRCTKLEGREWENFFSHWVNDRRCSPFIVARMKKNPFHSLPSNPVHRCKMGIKSVSHWGTELEKKEWKEVFLYQSMIKRCLPFIVARMRKNSFHSLPFNSVHTCKMGIKSVLHWCAEIEGREWKEVFFFQSMIKRCLPFIVARMRKNSFHSLPSNSVHRCKTGIICPKLCIKITQNKYF